MIISQIVDSESLFSNTIELFFKNYNISDLINKFFPNKRSGTQPDEIISYLLHLRFTSQTIYSNQNSDFLKAPCDENTIYRFLNNPENNWEGFLSALSSRILKETDSDQELFPEGVYIVDDTDRPRYNGKKVELNSWQFDHTGLCKSRHYRGFKELTLGYFAGGSYLPIDLTLSSSNNHLINASLLELPPDSPGERRRNLSGLGKIEAVFEMIESAQKRGYKARFLLADSWFTEPKTAFRALDHGLDYIGMVKLEGRTRYEYQGEMLTVREIFERFKTVWDKNSYTESVFIDVPVGMFSQGRRREVRLLYFDNIHEEKDYCCFLVTDLKRSALTIQKLYHARFGCEHCYKALKDTDTIRTLKNCQSLSFDANLAQSCLDLIVHNILVDLNRRSEEEPSVKSGFRQSRESIYIAKWLNQINELLRKVLEFLSEELKHSFDDLILLVKQFLTGYDPLIKEINKLSRFVNLSPANLIEKLLINFQL